MTQQQPKTGIVWLASYPRSGNTWARNFLNNLFQVLKGQGQAPKDINTLGEYTIWDIAAGRYQSVLGKSINEATRSEIAEARIMVQQHIADNADGAVFVKTHNALMLSNGHPTINMSVTSGAIYIVRNPLDVAISFAHHFNIDIDTAINHMGRKGAETDVNEHVAYEAYGSWSENVMGWTSKPHRAIYVMRYEDMVDEPLKTFGGLAEHLLLEVSQEELVRAVDLSSFENAKAQESAKGYRERANGSKEFFREGRAGQWEDVLSSDQVKRIVADHRQQMARFGYVPSGY